MAFTHTLPAKRQCCTTTQSTVPHVTASRFSQRPSLAKVIRQPLTVVKASEDVETAAPSAPSTAASDSENWVPVIAPEELPKGVRKEVRVGGKSILLFWYRNQIFAIDARSPAEGAYSEGFIKAKFTQDYGIECPTTGSVFSLKDGSITDYLPTNPILRGITPRPGNLPIYPVKLTQDAIMVSVEGIGATAATRGGADTSLESNNVFALMPPSYVAGSEFDETPASNSPVDVSTAATFSVALTAFGVIGGAGTLVAFYVEDMVLLGAFWTVLLGFGGYFFWQYQNEKNE